MATHLSPRTRIVGALIAGLALALPLGMLSHSGDRDAARLSAGTAIRSEYRAQTTDTDFGHGTSAGTAKANGALRIGTAHGTRTWAGKTYEYATWTSPWLTPGQPFTQLVPSWTATTPAGSWIQVLVRVRDDAGAASTTKNLGSWATADTTIRRASAGTQSDAVARVATDTVIAKVRPLASYRLTVRLMRRPGGAGPVVSAVGVVTSAPPATVPPTSSPLRSSAIRLGVPTYSQMIHDGQDPQYGGGGEAWCSPTSLAMILGYYGRLPAPSTYTWVPSSYADRWVNHVARLTYDYAYDGTGNWPFNTAYAATRTGTAFVTRLTNLRMAERFIRAGIPLALSIRFSRGQLTGAPISATNGHLVVLTGFTAAGDALVNDPAGSSDRAVRRTYDRAQFERAWLGGSAGMAYVVTDAEHPLPARPTGVRNW